jgi:DNA repair exonuclease SbcCD ATPase subunit
MIFKQLWIENFFRIKKATFKLEDQGLVLVTGENGSGKSTLFEAIVWCLWGKTVRGKKGDDVVNNQINKDCWVRLLIEHDGEIYSIERFRKHHQFQNSLFFWHYDENNDPIDLSEGNPTLTQEKVTKFLGIDFDTYIRGPMVGQGKFKRFSEMTDALRKEVLEDAIQISILAKARNEVGSRLVHQHGKLTTESTAHSQVHQQLQTIKADLETLQENQAGYFLETLQTVAKINSEMAYHVLLMDNLEAELPEPVDITQLEETGQLLERLMTKLQQHWGKILEGLATEKGQLEASLGHQRAEIRRLTHDSEDAEELAGGPCPTCNQFVSQEHTDVCIAELQKQRADAEAHLGQLTVQFAQLESRHEEAQSESQASITRARENKNEAIRRWRGGLDLEQSRRNGFTQIDQEMRIVTEQRKQIADVKNSLNADPFQQLIEEKMQLRDRLEDQLGEINSRIDEINTKIQQLQFWDTGFGNSGLKSQVLAAVTPFMNDRARYYAKQITNGEATIEFSTQTKLKTTSEVRERFDVQVVHAEGAGDYEGSSGGEKGKADLAINFTFSDLMAMRAQKAYPQRFFDEPFESLDEAGIEAVMELLANMVKECGTIFVITHQEAMKALFNRVITVTKRGGESVFEA